MDSRSIYRISVMTCTALLLFMYNLTLAQMKKVHASWGIEQKIDSLCQWSWNERRNNLDYSLTYVQQAHSLAETVSDDCVKGKVDFYHGAVFFNKGDAEKGKQLYTHSLSLLENCSDPFLLARVYNGLGLCNADLSNFQEAIDNYELAMDIYVQESDSEGIALQKQNIGVIYYQVGQMDKALKNYLEAEHILVNMPNALSTLLANNYVNTAIIYNNLNDIETAKKYYRKAIHLYSSSNDRVGLGEAYSNLAVLFFDFNLDSSFYYHRAALTIYTQSGNMQREGVARTYVADIYREWGQHDSALVYYSQSLNLLHECSFSYGLISAYTGRGKMFREMHKYPQAVSDLLAAMDTAHAIQALSLEVMASFELAETYYQMGNFKEAYQTLLLHKTLSDSLLGVEKLDLMKNLEFSYETAKKQIIIEKLESEKQLYRFRFIFIVAGSALIILLLFVWFNRQRLNRQKSLALAEAKNALAETKLNAANADIEMRKKLLLSYAMRISEKNELLESIRDTLKSKKEFVATDKKEVISLINRHLLIPAEREEMDQLVKQTGEVFFQKLAYYADNLTDTEKKICVFLSLGLSSKEMASIINISPATVDNYRSSLRKKLKLDVNITLDEFLQKL